MSDNTISNSIVNIIQGRDTVSSLLPVPPNLFIGRDNDMAALRQRLFGEPSTTLITSVRGWPGIGKTTLAAAMAHDAAVKKAFPDGVLWTALGMSPNPLAGLGQWLLAFGDDPQRYQRIEERQNRLAGLLRDRRMLLIIDDVWQAADAQPFLVGGQLCRTLLTTREPDVARKLGLPDKAVYRLLVLSEEDSIELIRQLSPESVAQDQQGVRRLVQELEGLPLALQIAGRLLAAEAALGWGVSDLLDELAEGTRLLQEAAPADRTDLSSQTTPTVAVLLRKSTDRLDALTQKQFAFLGVFAPKPATFDRAAIAAAWGVDDLRPAIRELEKRGLLEPYQEDGEVRFQMHALLTVHAKTMWEAIANA
uniref:NB-ARC domain-containing protein n=1 Tax=Candidatus Electronema sp. TaxID=2698783 RepID=UPI004055D539